MGGAGQTQLPIAESGSTKVKLRVVCVHWCTFSKRGKKNKSVISHSTLEDFIGGQIFCSHCDVRGRASFQASHACTHCALSLSS